ncbi:Soluble starch synthase 1 [Durusdinium trenchii]|uniref:Chloroplastic/amyloplastic (Starch synthase I) n=1 Tax=Durusdinium trenchii TaxID=1381693 RepID=A0ABP0MXA5_9DINO
MFFSSFLFFARLGLQLVLFPYKPFLLSTGFCLAPFPWCWSSALQVHYYHHFQNYGEGKGCDYVFIDHPSFRRPGGLYHNLSDNQEYSDNLFRFALFSLAALEVPVAIELGGAPCYGGRVMFIANDWQTGLLPVYMVHRHRAFGNYNHARCMYVIHNLGYQGCYPLRLGLPGTLQYDNFAQLGLPFAALGDLLYQYPLHERTFEGDSGETLNLTKAPASDGEWERSSAVTASLQCRRAQKPGETVLGCNQELLLGGNSQRSGKRLCKRHLQRKLGLKEDDDACILSFVGRLTSQKGLCEELLGQGLTTLKGLRLTAIWPTKQQIHVMPSIFYEFA